LPGVVGRLHFNSPYFSTNFQEIGNMAVSVNDLSERYTRNGMLLCNHDKITKRTLFSLIFHVVLLPLDSYLTDASWKFIKQAVSTTRNTFSGSISAG
jgi:hypothetical protein